MNPPSESTARNPGARPEREFSLGVFGRRGSFSALALAWLGGTLDYVLILFFLS